MTVPFDRYALFKNRYCIQYLGEDKDVILKLLEFRSNIEKKYKDLELFLFVKDKFKPIGKKNIITEVTSKNYANQIAHLREISCFEDLKDEV